MKKFFTAFVMTQSMFCSLPFPCKSWKEEARPYMLLFLPVIGLEIGVIWIAANYLLRFLQVPDLVYGLVMCAIPYLVSGFIHLDGFLDVTDAISSWKTLEQRRAILKDSNVGAFAVIWCVFLVLAGFALFSSVPDTVSASGALLESVSALSLILIPVISRCCSAIAVMRLKPMTTSQYSKSQTYPKWPSVVLLIVLAICIAVCFVVCGKYGFVIVGGLCGYGLALWRSYRLLDGMNGDVSGYCLTISELCAVAVFVLI